MRAAIVGIAGPSLDAAEAAVFAARPPAGVILFARNIEAPAQLRALVASLRAVLPAGAVLMIDQEGGRVARLRPPHWRAHPPAAAVGACHAADPAAGLRAAWLTGALIGADCADAGFDVVCAPVLDRLIPGADGVIGDRAFAADPDGVAELGRAMAEGLRAAGVAPVMKHAPGHGRARADSHAGLPVVDDADDRDLAPFAANADLPWAMTAHILYTAWDRQAPATQSPHIIDRIIRGRIGFQGVLVTDDLAMGALTGSPAGRARAALAAGCDIALFCAGVLTDTRAVLDACPALGDRAAGLIARGSPRPLDTTALAAERDRILA